jgi:DNA-binding transcriptional LysR family regulator
MDIDPKTLRLLVRVIELGTVAAAAEKEHIAAAAVSKRIADLERSLGTSLLLRSNKGITATPAGMALVDLSRRILNDLHSLPAVVKDFARGIKGHVRVVANLSAITQFLPAQLNTFLQKHPGIRVHLRDSMSTQVGRQIAENAADLGILVVGTHTVPGLDYHPYNSDELVLLAPANHPLATRSGLRFEETLDFNYIGLQSGTQLSMQMIRAANEVGRSWICRMEVSSYDALALMVEAGLGIALLPRRLAIAGVMSLSVTIVELHERWAQRRFAICTQPYRELSSTTRILLDHLLETVPQLPHELPTADKVSDLAWDEVKQTTEPDPET